MSGINEQVINAKIYQIGPQGIPGEAATISVGTVTTGEPGTDANVTNSGTSTAAILDFVIPQGEQGLQGIQGPQGIQGLTGATGNGISSIEKIATVGLTDTYRITFTNNTYYDFEVTNGSSISDIEKTNTSGLVDTYTITLTNGDTHTFTVINGEKGDKGETGEVGNGILGVNKMSTTGLVDNYRMTFTNGTYFDFDVTNALSIQSIAKLSTSGLVDTYRITFNDSTYFDFPVTNGKGVTGVTLLSWEGLDKTYRMSFNDGSYFDFVVTNGAGSQVDWGGIYGVLSQQTDLQDALVQSNGLTTGSVSTYNIMLSELIERAHSTFDLSKFTVVGSPAITGDGVASGLGSYNYIYVNNFSCPNRFVFKGKFKPTTTTLEQRLFNIGGSDSHPPLGLGCVAGRRYQLFITSDNTNIASYYDSIDYCVTLNVWNYYKFSYDGSVYKLETSTDDKNYTTVATITSSEAPQNTAGKLAIGSIISDKAYVNFEGEIDLKQFSITVDGVEVFSGNKTGIDTIKPDDYTVVGSPNITDDGIASGFSSSNFVRISKSFANSSSINLIIKFNSNDISKTQKLIVSLNSNNVPVYGIDLRVVSSKLYLRLQLTSGWTSVSGAVTTLLSNQDYYIKFVYNNISGYRVYLSTTGAFNGEETLELSLNDTTLFNQSNNNYIGIGSGGDNDYVSGSIDLNAFKIYVDGDLVYQPCLKIPYTLSKTGSKIVKAIDRNRVDDMAKQFGYANYHTLDEDNGNFTLPQGELYGLIGDKTLRDSYYNGVTYWELFSNRRLEQGGTCVSGVEYTLPKPFADVNYTLTIPYSSKTATSFIPSATGDFIAKGMGLL